MQAPAAPPAAAPAAPPALDPTIVNLAKAIRQTETRGQAEPYTAKGASGEYGAYQYTEGTWNADAKKYLGAAVPLTSATKLQQNEVAYKKLADLKAAGNNVGQIASIWNSGSPEWEGKVGINSKGVKYDVPQYVNSVAQAYQALKAGQAPNYQDTASTVGKEQIVTPAQQKDAASAGQTGAFFPAVTGDSPLSAGLKTAGNLPGSAFNFAKGAVQSVNPVNILNTMSQIPGAFSGLVGESGGIGNAIAATAKELPGAAYNALVPQFGKDLVTAAGGFFTGNSQKTDEGLSAAQRDVTNDPVGSIAPFVFAAQGGAKLLDKTGITADASGALDRGISMAAKPVTAPASYAFGKAADLVSGTTKYLTAKATGFNPETISQIIEDPGSFTQDKISAATRGALGQEVAGKLTDRIDTLGDTGTAYNTVRAGTEPVKVDSGFLADALERATGLKLDVMKEGTGLGKFVSDAKSAVDSPTDIAKVQRLYEAWQPYFDKGELTADDFLTLRSKLATIANYEGIGKSAPLEKAAADIRSSLNTEFRDQIKLPKLGADEVAAYKAAHGGAEPPSTLSEVDADYSSQATELKALKKGILDKDGNLTDTAINRIANAAGKGKDQLLARLEDISPGITMKIRQLKAIEDIQNIHKVGTYAKATIEGGGLVGGIATGNIPLIAASIAALVLSQPEVAVRMIRSYGSYAKPLAGSVLGVLKKGTSAVNNLPQNPVAQASVFGRQAQIAAPAGQ